MVSPYLKNNGSAVRFRLWPPVKFLLKSIDISDIKRISFRQDINGLRAVAVLAVVFYHADIELFKGGWLGVDIFFVISGYLISNIIISDLNDGTFTFKNFYPDYKDGANTVDLNQPEVWITDQNGYKKSK